MRMPDLKIEIKESLNRPASVYTAECLALLHALNIVFINLNSKFIIFSDYLSSLQSLKSTKTSITTNPYILQIKKKYKEILNAGLMRVEFVWIPSHINIIGNETVDRLAKKATEEAATNPHNNIPFSDFFIIQRH